MAEFLELFEAVEKITHRNDGVILGSVEAG